MRISKEGVPCLKCGSAILGPMIPRPLDKCKACPADGRSACRASGLLEIPFPQLISVRSHPNRSKSRKVGRPILI